MKKTPSQSSAPYPAWDSAKVREDHAKTQTGAAQHNAFEKKVTELDRTDRTRGGSREK